MTVRELLDMLSVIDPNATVEMYTRCGPEGVVDIEPRGNCVILEGKNCCEHLEDCSPAEVYNKLNNISALIEDAKLKCKSQYGGGHYSQNAFWHFILAVEKEVGVL